MRAVFGDSDDSDDGADDRASSGRAAGPSPSGGTAAWDACGRPSRDLYRARLAPLGPAHIPGLVLARGALTPAAQAWLSRAIRADDLMDLPPLDQPPAVSFVHLATDADTAPSPRADLAEGSPSRRRNQAMRFGNFPPWARVLAARVRALAETAAPPCFPRGARPLDRLFDQRSATRTFPAKV